MEGSLRRRSSRLFAIFDSASLARPTSCRTPSATAHCTLHSNETATSALAHFPDSSGGVRQAHSHQQTFFLADSSFLNSYTHSCCTKDVTESMLCWSEGDQARGAQLYLTICSSQSFAILIFLYLLRPHPDLAESSLAVVRGVGECANCRLRIFRLRVRSFP